MFIHNINPVLLNLGPLEIRYYGLVYLFGFLFTIWYMTRQSKAGELKLTNDQIYDMFTWIILGTIVGGRLMHTLFYEPAYYLSHPLKILYIWEGGMAFHGALIAIGLVIYYFSKKYKVSFYSLADTLVIPSAIILAIGRMANFVNGELVGKISTVPWAVKFPNFEGYRHPYQIYSVIKDLLIFGILLFIKKNKPKEGVLFWTFILSYGLLRFTTEFFKDAEWYWLGLSAGQYLSIGAIVLGGVMLYRVFKGPSNNTQSNKNI